MRMRDWTTGLQLIRTKWLNVTINGEIQLNLIANIEQCRLKLNTFSIRKCFFFHFQYKKCYQTTN
jgi:hypothetical protein